MRRSHLVDGMQGMAKILIVEDNDAMRVFMAQALARIGHDVDTAPDAESAEVILTANAVDLLLADIELPGENGVELERRAVRRHPELRVMFVTGFAEMAARAADLLAKKTRILSKPFGLLDLTTHVSAMLKGVAPSPGGEAANQVEPTQA